MPNTGSGAIVHSGPCCRLQGMRVPVIVGAIALGMLLSGCTPQAPAGGPSASSGSSAEPSASETATPAAEVFRLPAVCADVLPASRRAQFDDDGIVLLGGPDGLYGDEYLLDDSPEQRAGGITCIWGPPDTELSSVTISVAPLRADARADIVTDLSVTQGLNETSGEGVTYYWKLGDRDGHPAILNALTADSWISVIETIGGTDSYSEAEKLAAEVHDLVYR
jgi:hypothetical protein